MPYIGVVPMLAATVLVLLLSVALPWSAAGLRVNAGPTGADSAAPHHGGHQLLAKDAGEDVGAKLFKTAPARLGHHGTLVDLLKFPSMKWTAGLAAPGAAAKGHGAPASPSHKATAGRTTPVPLRLEFEARLVRRDAASLDVSTVQVEDHILALDRNNSVVVIHFEEPTSLHAGRPSGGVTVDLAQAVRHESLPFFDKLVCFTFDMATTGFGEQDADLAFIDFASETLGVPLDLYEESEKDAEQLTVSGRTCDRRSAKQAFVLPRASEAFRVFAAAQSPELLQSLQAELGDAQLDGNVSVEVNATFCVDDEGHLLASNASRKLALVGHNSSRVLHTQATRTELHRLRDLRDVPPGDVSVRPERGAQGGRCLDLTSRGSRDTELRRPLNDAARLARINAEAKGAWQAAPYDHWHGYSVSDIIGSLGTGIRPLGLPLQRAAHRCKGGLGHGCPFADSAVVKPPKAFDSRTKWRHCPSIGTIRNQGQCGSCWAFAASGVLADRFCVAATRANATGLGFDNLTLSPQYLLDCDNEDYGCAGGHLDDAWEFLLGHGISEESCDPYLHCPKPNDPRYGLKDMPTGAVSQGFQKRACPGTCRASSSSPSGADAASVERKPRIFRASSAYAVAAPGDVESMQREIMTNGPVEVAFFVFSDFQSYRNGTYFRTPSAVGPLGGHAVRLIGWGVDEHKMPYWTVANSYGRGWGEHGYFRIRRGTNECGIETTPAAGLPAMPFFEGPVNAAYLDYAGI